jgi:hypothetical protein
MSKITCRNYYQIRSISRRTFFLQKHTLQLQHQRLCFTKKVIEVLHTSWDKVKIINYKRLTQKASH